MAQDSYIETIKIVVSLQTPTTGTRLIGGFAGIEVDGVKVVEGAGYATLTFPTNNNFDCFEPGDVVQDPDVKVISKEPDATPPTITVDGGDWAGSDGSGTPGEQTTLVKKTPYDSKLTVAGPTDLADMTGSVFGD